MLLNAAARSGCHDMRTPHAQQQIEERQDHKVGMLQMDNPCGNLSSGTLHATRRQEEGRAARQDLAHESAAAR